MTDLEKFTFSEEDTLPLNNSLQYSILFQLRDNSPPIMVQFPDGTTRGYSLEKFILNLIKHGILEEIK